MVPANSKKNGKASQGHTYMYHDEPPSIVMFKEGGL